MSHKFTMLFRATISFTILSLTISEEISPSHPINSTRKAEPVSINVSDLLRNYARVLSNSTVSTSAKKAFQDDEAETPAPNQAPTGINGGLALAGLNPGGLGGIFDSGPNGNIFGQVTVTDLVPYLVQNVLSPLVQRVIVDGNLVNNFYSLWNGVSGGEGASSTQAPPVPAPAEAPPKKENIPIAIAVVEVEEEGTTPKGTPLNRRRTRGSTTTEKSSTSKANIIEGESSTSKSKYKLIQRRTRPSSSSSTQQPFEENQDDEDESIIFNKLSHL